MFTLARDLRQKGLEAKKSGEKPINFSIIPPPNTVNISLLVPQAKGAERGARAETFETPWPACKHKLSLSRY